MKITKPAALKSMRLSWILNIACWMAYAAAYVGRYNFSAALASIVSSGVMTKPEGGVVSTVFFFCYGAGQIVMGYISDRLPARRMVTAGLFTSAVFNLLMTAVESPTLMAVIWGLNGIAQSMLWAPILCILTNELHPDLRIKAGVMIASSPLVGTLTAYFFAALTASTGWRPIFVISGCIVALAAAAWVCVCGYLSHVSPETVTIDTKTASAAAAQQAASGAKAKNILVLSGIAFMILPVIMHGMLKEGIGTWVPTMITETYGASPTFSIFISMILPVINLSGVFIAMFVFSRFAHENEMLAAAMMIGFSALPLISLLFIGRMPAVIAVVMMSVVTSLMHGFNHLLLTMASMRFGKAGRAGSMTGILNCVTYAGCAISGYGFGALAETFGWQGTVWFWIGIAVVASCLSMTAVGRWRRFLDGMKNQENS